MVKTYVSRHLRSTKKYDNDSPYFKDWTTKKLKEEVWVYHQQIDINKTYNSRDMDEYIGIQNELRRRGIKRI